MKTARELSVITFQPKEKTKWEATAAKRVDDLMEVVNELLLVEKMTNRNGLALQACIALSNVLLSAMRLAMEQNEARR